MKPVSPDSSESRYEQIQPETGHRPLRIRREGNKFYLPDGTELVPNIRIGSEPHHLQMFIEYERTFGRGIAKSRTHDPAIYNQPVSIENFGAGFGEEYCALGEEYDRLVSAGTSEQVVEYIKKLDDYRSRHPGLYTDVNKGVSEAPRIRVRKDK